MKIIDSQDENYETRIESFLFKLGFFCLNKNRWLPFLFEFQDKYVWKDWREVPIL